MTVHEAVQLILHSTARAMEADLQRGRIIVLDMGEPVKIIDIARRMIRLAGLEPERDVPIKIVGLRPGEKLYEELLMKEEGIQETANKLIHIGRPIEMDDEEFKKQLILLEQACKDEVSDMKDIVSRMVPTYKQKIEA
jgi:FlaA1/EpsC-like NDP-sugar epimerase